ncbi:MAG TPA: D-2-hydroxyacid dehydrogenase [Clostridia bacterium]|nr:D-2-hydroxyacid dehydrogenase [Clostridia bacterium]
MKIVILDGYTENPGDLSWSGFEKLGVLTVYDRTSIDDIELIKKRIGDADAVIVNKTPLSKEIFDSCTSIKYVGMLSTGYDVIDIKAAKEKNILVSNIPTYGTESVSQFAIALLLEICHHIGHHSHAVYNGAWEKSLDWCFWDYPLIELKGKTMGIIGYGRIGQTTSKIAQALGMNVLASDAYKNLALENDMMHYEELDKLLEYSDVIILHCPLLPETNGIINKKNILKMKDSVIIINNSRGALIVEEDLAEALNTGKVSAAGLDVVSTEPIRSDNPLLKAKNCFITPHISWAPKESRQRLMDIAVENFKSFIEGNPLNVISK